VPLATPGTTRALAWVRITDSGAQVYAPGIDLPPSVAAAAGKSPWPRNIEAATVGVNKAEPEGGGY
jgi:hypothetical protein